MLKMGEIDPVSGQPVEIVFLDPEESKRFELGIQKEGPTADRFLLDLVSTKSKWNKALAVVFAHHLISSELYGYGQQHFKEIGKGFLVHLKTIRLRLIEKEDEDDVTKLDKASDLARDMRRRSVSTFYSDLLNTQLIMGLAHEAQKGCL